MSHSRLQIAFLTSTNALDKRSWSGIHYYMSKALERNCGDVHYIGDVTPKLAIFKGKAVSYLAKKFTGKRYEYRHSLKLARAYGKMFSQKVQANKYDIIFAPAASVNIAFLETDVPIVYLSDTTFANMVNYYPAYTNLSKRQVEEGNKIESLALAKAKYILYPSQWAANSAMNDYGVDKSKISVFPLGANIEDVPQRDTVIKEGRGKQCKLLFLGVNWERKGGAIAFDTLCRLNEMGIDAELIVCGCVPPSTFTHEKMRVIPFLNKNEAKEYATFRELLATSDFLLLPSRSECFGIVFCEASAFGLPSIAAETGGIGGAVKNGVNGVLLPYNAGGGQYAIAIKEIITNNESYYALRNSSRELFDTSLNWDSWARRVSSVIQK